MEEAQKFGARLRELRIQAVLTQRQLADRVGVDFTYLSKIENGVLPPPSERVILKLAEILHADEDELVTLAGKIPADIAQMLKNQKTLQLLRSKRTQKKVMPKATKPRLTLPKISIPFNNYKAFARVAVAIVLVIAVGASLWFASPLPVKALEISFPSQSTSGTLGSTYTFTVKIDVQDMDVLPVWRADLEIYNVSDSSKKATLENLPLATSAKATHTVKEGSTSGSAQLKAAAATDWGYGIAYSYGYGYREVEGQGWHYFDTRGGYGYSQSPYKEATSITYTVYWTSPSGWPEGDYKIKTLVYGSSDKQFSGTSSSFSLSTAAPVIGGGAAPQPVVGDVSDVIDEDGVFTKLTTLESEDEQVNLFIPKGTVGQTEKGKALDEITITKVTTSPEPPEGTNTIGLNYDLGPDGATFDPPIVLTFTYNAAWIPQGASEENLTIAYYDEDSGQWVMLDAADITVNPDTNTISAKISHFTKFSVMALVEPATLTASGLTITPSKANIAERITISATITNDGDLSGSQDISLKINGEVVSTKKVTLAGHATEKVTFVTVQGKPGSYTVDVNGQSGTFTIKPVPTEPVVITSPPAPPVPAPAPPAPSPAPAPPTPAPTPAPAPVNWWLIGIIAAVTVIVVGFVVWFFAFRREY